MLKDLWNKTWQKEFLRNSAKLLSANALGQIIALLLLSFITRIYSQHDMGVLGLFLSVGGFLAMFAGGKYEFAILLEKTRARASAVFDLTFLLILSFSVCVALVLFVAGDELLEALEYDSLKPYTWMLPIYIFLCALGLSLTYWFNYNKQYTRLGAYSLGQVAGNNFLKLGLGLWSPQAFSLIIANLLGFAGALCYSLFPRKNRAGLFRFSPRLMRQAARDHRNFPVYYLPRSVINFFSANLVTLLLAGPFGMEVIGLYAVATMLGSRPVGLISDSLEQVLSQNLTSKISHREPVLKPVRKLTLRTAGMALPAFALIYFLLPWVIDWFLGAEWNMVAVYLRLLLPFYLLMLIAGPLSSVPGILGAQGMALGVEIVILCIRIAMLVIGILLGSFTQAVALFSVASTVILIGQYFWYYSLLRRYERSIA